jgi:hypothetical protein
MKEYAIEPEKREVLNMAADRMYDAIRKAGAAMDMNKAIDACNRVADDYDAALSSVTPDLAARVRRTL